MESHAITETERWKLAAQRAEREAKPVLALLFRNEAYRIEQDNQSTREKTNGSPVKKE